MEANSELVKILAEILKLKEDLKKKLQRVKEIKIQIKQQNNDKTKSIYNPTLSYVFVIQIP
jgi:hypothetical protein